MGHKICPCREIRLIIIYLSQLPFLTGALEDQLYSLLLFFLFFAVSGGRERVGISDKWGYKSLWSNKPLVDASLGQYNINGSH